MLAKTEQVCKVAELSAAQKELWAREQQVDAVKTTPRNEPQAARHDARGPDRPNKSRFGLLSHRICIVYVKEKKKRESVWYWWR